MAIELNEENTKDIIKLRKQWAKMFNASEEEVANFMNELNTKLPEFKKQMLTFINSGILASVGPLHKNVFVRIQFLGNLMEMIANMMFTIDPMGTKEFIKFINNKFLKSQPKSKKKS